MTIEILAGAMAAAFETRTRANGDAFVCLKDGAPEWMTEIVRAAHDGSLPDDWTYDAVRQCVDLIAEGNDPDDVAPEADVYTSDLLAWAPGHVDLIDQCMADFGPFASLCDLLMAAQSEALRSIMGTVAQALADRVEKETDAA